MCNVAHNMICEQTYPPRQADCYVAVLAVAAPPPPAPAPPSSAGATPNDRFDNEQCENTRAYKSNPFCSPL